MCDRRSFDEDRRALAELYLKGRVTKRALFPVQSVHRRHHNKDIGCAHVETSNILLVYTGRTS